MREPSGSAAGSSQNILSCSRSNDSLLCGESIGILYRPLQHAVQYEAGWFFAQDSIPSSDKYASVSTSRNSRTCSTLGGCQSSRRDREI